jgi:flavin reductase (DIM6/NTAB) family NADH-FMN oxidoreductase RutF
MSAAPTVDPETIRAVHRQFVTGVTVVTTVDSGTPRGLAVNAFCSVSLEPPLVLVCVQSTSATYPALFKANHLAVNILAADQLDVVRTFAAKGVDKFAAIDWTPGPHGSPLIEGSAASIEVNIQERLQSGTHTVFVGQVVEARHREIDPLVYRSGNFYTPSALRPLTV